MQQQTLRYSEQHNASLRSLLEFHSEMVFASCFADVVGSGWCDMDRTSWRWSAGYCPEGPTPWQPLVFGSWQGATDFPHSALCDDVSTTAYSLRYGVKSEITGVGQFQKTLSGDGSRQETAGIPSSNVVFAFIGAVGSTQWSTPSQTVVSLMSIVCSLPASLLEQTAYPPPLLNDMCLNSLQVNPNQSVC